MSSHQGPVVGGSGGRQLAGPLTGRSTDPHIPGVTASHATDGNAVHASSQQGIGVRAIAQKEPAVYATSDAGIGVDARSTKNTGVFALSEQGIGVHAKGGKHAGYFEGNVVVHGSLNVGDAVVLDGPNKKLSLGHATLDGHDSHNSIVVSNDNNVDTVWIHADPKNGGFGGITLRDNSWKETIQIDADHRKLAVGRVVLDGLDSHNSIVVSNDNNVDTVWIHADPKNGGFGGITLRDNNWNETIQIDGDQGDIRLMNGDCAEEFEVAQAELAEPGTVMVLNENGQLEHSTQPYDKRVAGVVSGAGNLRPGLVLGRDPGNSGKRPIALLGKVYAKVDAEYGSIGIGDLLTTSPTPGHAMKASDATRSFGAVLGKALRPLQRGTGSIPVLVALQ